MPVPVQQLGLSAQSKPSPSMWLGTQSPVPASLPGLSPSLGWTTLITRCARGACTVRFLEAVDGRGVPYEDVQLQLTILQPI